MSIEIKKITIGLFAHNEESNILRTLDSLSEQNIFCRQYFPQVSVTLTVVANGCSDNTVPICRTYLANSRAIDGNILEIEKSGKSSAWNEFVHHPNQAKSDYIVCMDSDIRFGSDDVISTLVSKLELSNEAYLAVDIAQKDTVLKARKTAYERLSLFFSNLMKRDSTAVAGSLYCAKGDQLRKITLPKGLPVEDGFLRAMIVTGLFTEKDKNQRILVAEDVCHYFTPDQTIKSLLRHEERLLIGTFINSVIYEYLWAEVPRLNKNAGQIVHENNANNPAWVENLIDRYRENNDPLIPRHFYFKYWKRWKTFPLGLKLISLPVVTIACTIKFYLLKKVERRLAHESGLGVW